MSENKGLSDQELLKLCKSGEAITGQDIGGIIPHASNVDTNDLNYLSESGMRDHNPMNFSGNGNKDNDSDK